MTNLLLRWIVLVVSIIAAAYLVGVVMPSQMEVQSGAGGIASLFVGAAVLAVVNATLGKALKFMTLPLSCLTLGLFALVINAALFYAVGSLGLGFHVKTFWAALLGSILVSAISAVLGAFLPDEKRQKE